MLKLIFKVEALGMIGWVEEDVSRKLGEDGASFSSTGCGEEETGTFLCLAHFMQNDGKLVIHQRGYFVYIYPNDLK